MSSVDILPCPFSDHCALSLAWALPDFVPPGSGLKELNRSPLDKGEYIDLISTSWYYWQSRQSSFSSLTGWCDSSKSHIKHISKGHSKCKVVERNISSSLAAHLKSYIDSGRVSFLPVFLSTLSRLRALDLEVACGAQVCARSRWVEEGKSSSAYFFWLEQKNGTDRNISALRASDVTWVTDKDG